MAGFYCALRTVRLPAFGERHARARWRSIGVV